MEPSYSLQDHIFNGLERYMYRDINTYNPLNITDTATDNFVMNKRVNHSNNLDVQLLKQLNICIISNTFLYLHLKPLQSLQMYTELHLIS